MEKSSQAILSTGKLESWNTAGSVANHILKVVAVCLLLPNHRILPY